MTMKVLLMNEWIKRWTDDLQQNLSFYLSIDDVIMFDGHI